MPQNFKMFSLKNQSVILCNLSGVLTFEHDTPMKIHIWAKVQAIGYGLKFIDTLNRAMVGLTPVSASGNGIKLNIFIDSFIERMRVPRRTYAFWKYVKF